MSFFVGSEAAGSPAGLCLVKSFPSFWLGKEGLVPSSANALVMPLNVCWFSTPLHRFTWEGDLGERQQAPSRDKDTGCFTITPVGFAKRPEMTAQVPRNRTSV